MWGFGIYATSGIITSVLAESLLGLNLKARTEEQGGVAHRLEQAAHNRLVVGSIPTAPTNVIPDTIDCATR